MKGKSSEIENLLQSWRDALQDLKSQRYDIAGQIKQLENCIRNLERCNVAALATPPPVASPLPTQPPVYVISDERPRNVRGSRIMDVWRKDGGICYLCEHPVPRPGEPSDTRNHPTVEHVVPRAKGGKNTMTNMRLAHAWCNTVKGDADLTPLLCAQIRQHYPTGMSARDFSNTVIKGIKIYETTTRSSRDAIEPRDDDELL